MPRQTKIISTLGPATDKPNVLEQMILNGVNVVRFNFSHGKHEDHLSRAEQVRTIAKKLGKTIAILGDLQGPKIRICNFQNGSVQLNNGSIFALDTSVDPLQGDEKGVNITYPSLINDCNSGDVLLLDDGRLRLQVEKRDQGKLTTRVIAGGFLSNRKGINRLGGGINAPSLTAKDIEDIKLAARIRCEYLALSFVRDADDLAMLYQELEKLSYSPYVVAKIERNEAVADQAITDSIIQACDCIMVARGDLGVELGEARLVGVQKHLIQRAVQLNRSVITATQMMESMIDNIIPTRAEVFDVANAVLDGTDAVMLSAETASGKHPAIVVKAMNDICEGAEEQVQPLSAVHRISDKVFTEPQEAIAYASLHTALQLKGVKAIVSFTESGNTPLWISRIRGNIPIIGVSRNYNTLSRMAMWRGVFPIQFDVTQVGTPDPTMIGLKLAHQHVELRLGDMLIFTYGDTAGISGTNRMHIVTISGDTLTSLKKNTPIH